jgi:N-methylhydantoinase B
MAVDPFRLDVFKSLFASVADEMGSTLGRSAYSVNIKERKDFSCAVFDGAGRMISQAAHIPVHLGSMPLSVEAARQVEAGPGDVVVLNDPYRGGTHLPDVTLVRPVFIGRRRRFFVACRAHFSDIGGMTPGSMPVSRDLFQEGLVLPPVKLTPEVRAVLTANVRNPREVEGDLAALAASCLTGERRLLEMCGRYGFATAQRYADGLQRYGRRWMEAAIREIPTGRWTFEDELDDDGVGGPPAHIRVAIRRRGSRAVVDFSGSGPQVAGNLNAVYAVTLSAVLYCFRCLVEEEIPLNAGAAEAIEVIAPPGTVVNARPPAAVTAGNVETSQRIVDVVFGALAKALPGRIPAASQGTMNNVSFGGRGFSYYETVAGGMGASARRDGASATHSHMTNTLNTPIEAFEHAYPVRIERYAIRRGSGGAGAHRGGDGIVREYRFLEPAQASVISERRRKGPYGLRGGGPGRPGRNLLNGRALPAKANFDVEAGDLLRIETPGGGGHGRVGSRR